MGPASGNVEGLQKVSQGELWGWYQPAPGCLGRILSGIYKITQLYRDYKESQFDEHITLGFVYIVGAFF